jgi:hypothetical protein
MIYIVEKVRLVLGTEFFEKLFGKGKTFYLFFMTKPKSSGVRGLTVNVSHRLPKWDGSLRSHLSHGQCGGSVGKSYRGHPIHSFCQSYRKPSIECVSGSGAVNCSDLWGGNYALNFF